MLREFCYKCFNNLFYSVFLRICVCFLPRVTKVWRKTIQKQRTARKKHRALAVGCLRFQETSPRRYQRNPIWKKNIQHWNFNVLANVLRWITVRASYIFQIYNSISMGPAMILLPTFDLSFYFSKVFFMYLSFICIIILTSFDIKKFSRDYLKANQTFGEQQGSWTRQKRRPESQLPIASGTNSREEMVQ